MQVGGAAALTFAGSLLQLRGRDPVSTPLYDDNSNILVWNGEVFGGLDVPIGGSDSHALFHALTTAEPASIPQVLSGLRGPWAIVFWHAATSTLWFGRDVLGRRSLLIKWPQGPQDPFLLSSLVPLDPEVPLTGYCDVVPGLYCIDLSSVLSKVESTEERLSVGWISEDCVTSVPWFDPDIESIKRFERDPNLIHPPGSNQEETQQDNKEEESGSISNEIKAVRAEVLDAVLSALRSAVASRCRCIDTPIRPLQQEEKVQETLKSVTFKESTENTSCGIKPARVMILFSGGADSTLLAALAHESLPSDEPIDLVSICFANGTSPDRLAALDAFEELQSIAPSRAWRLIGADRSIQDVDAARNHLLRLLAPSDTVMDLNIGAALWLASAGEGIVLRLGNTDEISNIKKDSAIEVGMLYCSAARCVLLGHGADELFGGYGRHRTRFRNAGWEGLAEELTLDVTRLWVRNLGRDDRLVADRGREARHPFLDEGVVLQALKWPLWALTDLRLPPGTGDKLVLRGCLQRLGLERAAKRVKRAIQFGTRLAKATNAAQVR